jgi:hypothetical protein
MVLDDVEKVPTELVVKEFLTTTNCKFEDFAGGVYSILPEYLDFAFE